MFNVVSSVPVDCNLVLVGRVLGAALLGVAVVALEAGLRVPVRPLFDGYLQEAQVRVSTFFRNFAF